MPTLCVNIDHVATVRNARRIDEPDPLAAAIACEQAGAAGITFHLREDRRHIIDRDARLLREVVRGLLNMEMANTEEMVDIALQIRGDQVTFVPERREEITTEGGLDVAANRTALAKSTKRLRAADIRVSMFIDPLAEQVRASKAAGATHIEFHTGKYCELFDRNPDQALKQLDILTKASRLAIKQGLIVNAGHGLNYRNVGPVARIAGMNELNIGHAIIGRAIFSGLDCAVRDMIALISTE